MVSFACDVPFRNYVIGYVWLKIYVHNFFPRYIQHVRFSYFKIPNKEKTPVFDLIKSLSVNFMYLTVAVAVAVAVIVVVVIVI